MVPDHVFRQVLRARERLLDQYAEPLTTNDLARVACLSPFHFLRMYRAAFGDTPGRDLSRVRLSRARDLLGRGVPATEACFAVGFSSLGSFSARFAREFGASPRAFQREVRAFGAVPARLAALYVPFCFVQHYLPEHNRNPGEVADVPPC